VASKNNCNFFVVKPILSIMYFIYMWKVIRRIRTLLLLTHGLLRMTYTLL
jgi:hypothetical protein